MIEVQLYHDAYHNMNKDKTLEGFFPVNSAVLQSTMSREAFDDFCKANNVIPIRHHLRNYLDNQIVGEFNEI